MDVNIEKEETLDYASFHNLINAIKAEFIKVSNQNTSVGKFAATILTDDIIDRYNAKTCEFAEFSYRLSKDFDMTWYTGAKHKDFIFLPAMKLKHLLIILIKRYQTLLNQFGRGVELNMWSTYPNTMRSIKNKFETILINLEEYNVSPSSDIVKTTIVSFNDGLVFSHILITEKDWAKIPENYKMTYVSVVDGKSVTNAVVINPSDLDNIPYNYKMRLATFDSELVYSTVLIDPKDLEMIPHVNPTNKTQ